MKRFALALLVSTFAVGSAAAAPTCASKAVDKNGKALAGAAKTSFMKKCCDGAAVSSAGKALAGAAKASFVKKCMGGG